MSEIELEKIEKEKAEPTELENTVDKKQSSSKLKLSLFKRIKNFFQNPKKRKILIASVIGLIVIIFGAGFLILTRGGKGSVTEVKQSESKDSSNEAKYPAILDGVMTDQVSANKHPLAIVVENHPDARPQAGLSKASIVYEAIAEGGITRFLALYGTYESEKVGPVRSARTYFVDWAHGYNAYPAHVGGNIDALDKIAVEKTLDLDQFRYSGPYWRERNNNVATEHTMFTSTFKLRTQAEKNNYSAANNFSVYKFKDDLASENRPDSQKLTVTFQDTAYQTTFEYDKASDTYKRSMTGSPHKDSINSEQLSPKNIVVMTVQRKATKTRINEDGYNMTTIGNGKAKFFMDGTEFEGTWKKDLAEDREIFYDAGGNEVTFNRGQLWICVIPPDGGSATAS